MFRRFRTVTASIPTPLAGLALGIAGLGTALESALPLHSLGQTVGALVSLALLSAIAAKFILRPRFFAEELKHPVLGSILPTFPMAMMVVSKTLSLWVPALAELLWLTAVVAHLLLFAGFLLMRLRSFKLQQMVPSWFVPSVGVCIAALTVPSHEYDTLARGLMLFGMINYALLLPVMSYRLIFSAEIADASKPTIAIMAAPASLSLAAYLSLESNPSLLLCGLLLGLALLMTAIIYLAFFKLLRLPFSPAYASYTFPLAVGATALYKAAECLAASPATLEYGRQLSMLAAGEIVVACLIIGYVCLRYALHYGSRLAGRVGIGGFVAPRERAAAPYAR